MKYTKNVNLSELQCKRRLLDYTSGCVSSAKSIAVQPRRSAEIPPSSSPHKTAIITFFIFAVLSPLCLSAQERGSIALLCSPRPDSVMLRWAPADVETWLLGNRYGYVVTRYVIFRDGALTDDMAVTVLGSQSFAPRPLEEWEAHEDDRDAKKIKKT